MSETVELTDGVVSLLQKYQRPDEDLDETLDRVMSTFVPQRFELEPAGIDPTSVDPSTAMLIERGRTGDGGIRTRTYDHATRFMRHNEEMAESVLGVTDA
jgi:hypothetical protein